MPICVAHRKSGEPCSARAMNGADKCRMHVGKKAAAVIVEAKARQQLARMDVAPITDPLTELGKIAGEVVAWKDSMREKVNALTSIRYDAGESGEQLRAEVALLERAFDRCERFLTAMARLDIDERLARVTIAQKLMVLRAVEAALASAGVAGPAAVEAKKVAARHLREVA